MVYMDHWIITKSHGLDLGDPSLHFRRHRPGFGPFPGNRPVIAPGHFLPILGGFKWWLSLGGELLCRKKTEMLTRMSVIINAAMPWFIITFSLMTTLALYGSFGNFFNIQSCSQLTTFLGECAIRQPGHIDPVTGSYLTCEYLSVYFMLIVHTSNITKCNLSFILLH